MKDKNGKEIKEGDILQNRYGIKARVEYIKDRYVAVLLKQVTKPQPNHKFEGRFVWFERDFHHLEKLLP